MNQDERNLSVEQFYRNAALVWVALLSSQIVFVVVVYFTKPEIFKFDFSKPLTGENPPLVLIFFGLAVMNVGLSLLLKNILIKKAVQEQKVALVQTGMIVGSALAETASILGLLSALLFSYQYFFILSIIGVIGILLHFPQRQNFIDASFRDLNK